MSNWSGAWYLAKHEIKRERWGFLFPLIFMVYLVVFTAPAFESALSEQELRVFSWSYDFIMMSILPVFGFCVNKAALSYHKNDYYTSKLKQWRVMPITLRQIVMGRLVQFTIILTISLLFYFTFSYLYLNLAFSSEIDLMSFVLYGLTWFGYSLVIGSSLIYLELGTTGKVYFALSIVYVLLFLLATILMSVIIKGSISYFLLSSIESGAWWIPILGLGIGFSGMYGMMALIERMLGKRDLSK